MGVAEDILTSRKQGIWQKYRQLRSKRFPVPTGMSEVAEKAIQRAYLSGLQEGYGEGLVDGVDLGLDVGVGMATTPPATSMSPFDLS